MIIFPTTSEETGDDHRHWPHAALNSLTYQNHQWQTLMEIALALANAIGHARVEHTLVEGILELVKAETACLIFFEGEDLIISCAAGREQGLLRGLVIPARETVCARYAHRKESGILDERARQRCAEELLLLSTPGSAVLAPLVRGETVSGVLAVFHSEPDSFDPFSLNMLQYLAQIGVNALSFALQVETLKTQSKMLQHSQDQRIHDARMATVGRLTAALAHEINNPLQSILGSVKFVLEQASPDFAHRVYLELAASELDRVADILQRMVGFYRRDTVQRQPTDLNALVRETLALAEKQLQRHHVAVITDLSPDLSCLPIAPNQLKQVFLNIMLNAAEAMPQGGRLYITTQQTQANGVEISFTDTGPGIPEQEIGRIFESFYTTKPHGTGLGLAISRDIIQAHGGELEVESPFGQGATFRVWLPLPD